MLENSIKFRNMTYTSDCSESDESEYEESNENEKNIEKKLNKNEKQIADMKAIIRQRKIEIEKKNYKTNFTNNKKNIEN